MNPQILLALATLAVALPAIVDEIIKAKIANALSVALLTSLVGVLFGGASGLLTQLAHGSTWSDAGTVFLAGTISGVAAALANYASMIGKARALAAAAAPLKIASLLVFVAFASIALPNTGCKLFQPGSPVPADIESDYDCVVRQIEAGQTNVIAMAGACGNLALSTVIDIVDTLLASPSFVASHSASVEKLRASLGEAKAKLAAGAK